MTVHQWHRTRLKYICDTNVAVLPDGTDQDFEFVYIDIGNVTQGRMVTDGKPIEFRNAPSRARRLAKPGDTVVSTVRTYLRAVATVPPLEGVLVFSTGFAVLSPREEVDPRFLSWYLQGDEFVSRVEANSTGVSYPAITATQLVALDLRLPPLRTQRAIADYLDRETARIDTLLEEQQRLIEMLTERRSAALIDAFASMHAETPIVAREPIPWLPGLHAEQAQMRHLCTIGTGSSDSANAVDEGYPFFVRGDQPLTLDTYEFDTEAIITAGDGAMVGRSFHHFRGKFAAHQRVYVLRDFNRVFPRYVYWYFSTFFIRVVGDGGAQATVPSVRMPMIASLPVPIPAYDEQRRIAAYLDARTARIDALLSETERFIELSRERRSALITAAVTGQIHLREVA